MRRKWNEKSQMNRVQIEMKVDWYFGEICLYSTLGFFRHWSFLHFHFCFNWRAPIVPLSCELSLSPLNPARNFWIHSIHLSSKSPTPRDTHWTHFTQSVKNPVRLNSLNATIHRSSNSGKLFQTDFQFSIWVFLLFNIFVIIYLK